MSRSRRVTHTLSDRQARKDYFESEDPSIQDTELIPDSFDHDLHHSALAFDHYMASYDAFLVGADAYPEQERIVEEKYGTLRPVLNIARFHKRFC